MIAPAKLKTDHPSLEYTLPFLIFLAFMGVERLLPLPLEVLYPFRLIAVGSAIVLFSWPAISFRVSAPGQSIVIGVVVWLIWVAPDVLLPGYRQFWLFENVLTGTAESTLPTQLRNNLPFLLVRVAGSVLIVPVIEELFWRSWLMRWLIDRRFWKIPMGGYTTNAFWTVAILFAVEHGPFWDVGLIAGIIYNWWMIRTRSLGDCILAHAVTNACLALHVVVSGQWQYWL